MEIDSAHDSSSNILDSGGLIPFRRRLCNSNVSDGHNNINCDVVIGLNLSTQLSLQRPQNNYQIMKYGDHTVVLYNPILQNLGARKISLAEEAAISQMFV